MLKQTPALKVKTVLNSAKIIGFLIVCFGCQYQTIQARTTALKYQGTLTDGGMLPPAQDDFVFRSNFAHYRKDNQYPERKGENNDL